MPPLGSPLQDFDDDMSQIDAAFTRIRAAIDDVRAAMGPPPVWMGDSADNWAIDFGGRMEKLENLMQQMLDERPSLQKLAAQQKPYGPRGAA